MHQKLQVARLQLARQYPYLSLALWSLTPVERPGIGTLAVDKYWRLYYDPAVCDSWSNIQLAGALYHEICHLLRDHPNRSAHWESTVANLATDMEINDNLLDEGIVLPDGAIVPTKFGLPVGLLAEEYYTILLERYVPPQCHSNVAAPGALNVKPVTNTGVAASAKPGSSDGSKSEPATGSQPATGSGQPSDHSGSDAASSDTVSDLSHIAASHTGAESPMPGKGRCGSCAHGQHEPWEEGPPDDDTPGISESESKILRRHVAEAICAATQSSGRGTIPGHWRRWAEKQLVTHIDWRRELAVLVRHAITMIAGMTDYSYSRPSRRQVVSRAILPAMRQPIPEVAVVVDTSGSIDDTKLAQALAIVSQVLTTIGAHHGICVLSVDSQVHACKRAFRISDVQLLGGGGTNMAAGIDAAMRLRPKPQVIIVLTDGETPWPQNKPRGIHVIAGLLARTNKMMPSWIKVVHITEASHGAKLRATIYRCNYVSTNQAY